MRRIKKQNSLVSSILYCYIYIQIHTYAYFYNVQ